MINIIKSINGKSLNLDPSILNKKICVKLNNIKKRNKII